MNALTRTEIPHDIQKDVVLLAVQTAAAIARQTSDGDPEKAARAVAEAGVLAWKVMNGVSP